MDRSADEEAATDELVTLLLDDLGPALQWYRDEVARVELLPHAARDAVLEAQRRAVRRSLREMVGKTRGCPAGSTRWPRGRSPA